MTSSEPMDRPSVCCVLIAVDESDDAVRTAQVARRLMGEAAHYVLVNVGSDTLPWATDPVMWGTVPPSMILLAPDSHALAPDPSSEAAAEGHPGPVDRAEATASAVAASAGLGTAEAVGTTGRDRASAICTVAEEHHADVIVIGQRHRGWLDRLFSRSVTDDVLRKAPCPVLVVP